MRKDVPVTQATIVAMVAAWAYLFPAMLEVSDAIFEV